MCTRSPNRSHTLAHRLVFAALLASLTSCPTGASASTPEETAEALLTAAATHHAAAQDLLYVEDDRARATEEYLAAAGKYAEYIALDPHSPGACNAQYFLADCYFNSNRLLEARDAFQAAADHPLRCQRAPALVGVACSIELLMQASGEGHRDDPAALANQFLGFADAPAEIAPLQMSDHESAFVAAVDRVLAEAPKAEDAPRKQFVAGELLHYHNRFDDARKRFVWLVENHPESDLAVYATTLTADGLKMSRQLDALVQTLDAYIALPILGLDQALWDERREAYRVMRRSAQFFQAQELVHAGRQAEAAQRFMAFHEAYLGTELAVDGENNYALMALFNAALMTEALGDKQLAIQRYERLLELSGEQPHGERWAHEARRALHGTDPEKYPLPEPAGP